MAPATFTFKHVFPNEPTDAEIDDILHKIVQTFHQLELGSTHLIGYMMNNAKQWVQDLNEWSMWFIISLDWNSENPAAQAIYDKVYNNSTDTLPSCARVVYDDPHAWVLWSDDNIDKDNYDLFSVTFDQDDKFVIREWSSSAVIEPSSPKTPFTKPLPISASLYPQSTRVTKPLRINPAKLRRKSAALPKNIMSPFNFGPHSTSLTITQPNNILAKKSMILPRIPLPGIFIFGPLTFIPFDFFFSKSPSAAACCAASLAFL